ncbi:radical SAM protein [Methanococcus voltae]|uniref:Radical SAM domain protein n=1 Tax=Methanococcus voltae (strain ATCC BAA-1334 / A3) TaxID=456320 RepID=D7DRC7_METV3|nr:radical SAM protein [Methanococcus voltae]MCS3901064.1 radical SAM superfamily enzyme with C-terminal helix-hairpin-helix motif [Methanococcus voltae]
MRFLILDGYTDEPAGLGVPPYMGTYPRYVAGVLYKYKQEVHYTTIDKLREDLKEYNGKGIDYLNRYDAIIAICGFHTPGKYINANPATLREFVSLMHNFKGYKMLGGPVATKFGSSMEGGKINNDDNLKYFFDFVVEGDIEIVLNDIISEFVENKLIDTNNKKDTVSKINLKINPLKTRKYDEISEFAILGANIVKMHPNYPNIILEIETYRGCSRALSAEGNNFNDNYDSNCNCGCSFCTEPKRYGSPKFRIISDVIDEVKALAQNGIKYYRVGRQPCIFSYMSEESEKYEIPKPNPEALEKLFKGIVDVANPKILHIDNANPSVIARHEIESREIAKTLVKYCTGGNTAAFGVESFDKKVIEKNCLLTEPEDVFNAVQILNEEGGKRSDTGLPYLLPGINLLFGLKGENKNTFETNYENLKEIYDLGYMLRRINIRQVVPFFGTNITEKDIKKAQKFRHKFLTFREKIRNEVDNPMLKRMVPKGTVLKNVFIELKERDNLYFGRQFGSYPLLIGIDTSSDEDKKIIEIGKYFDIEVIGYGKRSITGKIIKN